MQKPKDEKMKRAQQFKTCAQKILHRSHGPAMSGGHFCRRSRAVCSALRIDYKRGGRNLRMLRVATAARIGARPGIFARFDWTTDRSAALVLAVAMVRALPDLRGGHL